MNRSSFAIAMLITGAVSLVVAAGVLIGCSGGEDGILDVEQPGAKLVVRKWLFRRSLLGETGEWKVAPGSYRTIGLCLSITDENDDKWKLLATSMGKDLTTFTVEEQKTTVIEVGVPLELRADVHDGGFGFVDLSLSITGRGGEEYGGTVTKNGTPLAAPTFTVVNGDGKEIGRGQFEYG